MVVTRYLRNFAMDKGTRDPFPQPFPRKGQGSRKLKMSPFKGDLEGLLRSASPSLQIRCKSAPYIGDIADTRWIQAYDSINFSINIKRNSKRDIGMRQTGNRGVLSLDFVRIRKNLKKSRKL